MLPLLADSAAAAAASAPHTALVDLDVLEDGPDEPGGGAVPQRPAQQAQAEADQGHVPEVVRGLEQPVHLGLEQEVVDEEVGG